MVWRLGFRDMDFLFYLFFRCLQAIFNTIFQDFKMSLLFRFDFYKLFSISVRVQTYLEKFFLFSIRFSRCQKTR